MIRLGIDGSNIRAGGGVTHLSQLLAAASPRESGIEKVIVWGGSRLITTLPKRDWLEACAAPELDRPLPWRMVWRRFALPKLLTSHRCDALFSPGGVTPARCRVPTFVMSQNLLPFERGEYHRFQLGTWERFRLDSLRVTQSGSMTRSAGIIFLSRHGRDVVLEHLDRSSGRSLGLKSCIVPHGIEERFFTPRSPAQISRQPNESDPFRLIYVSTVYYYKHQWVVAEAVAKLRARGIPIVIDFVGGGHRPAIAKLQGTIARLDPEGRFLRYAGNLPFEELHRIYERADALVFASSCETFGNILVEAMASGLPIASSSRGPMPEVLQDAAVFFDPERADSIEESLLRLLESPELRLRLSESGSRRARDFSWSRCAQETFQFISETVSAPAARTNAMRQGTIPSTSPHLNNK